jgi:hypothetical protein
MNWYPLKLTTHIRKYYFGERQIPERLKKQGLPDGTIAETWEISDYRDTTGTVTNGSFTGHTLHDLTLNYPDELVGQGWRGSHFPLLEKFLDASHMLPVHLEFATGMEQLKQGESCILPAAIGEVQILPDPEASLVVCYVPNLQIDIVEPLRAANYTDAQIQALGEVK